MSAFVVVFYRDTKRTPHGVCTSEAPNAHHADSHEGLSPQSLLLGLRFEPPRCPGFVAGEDEWLWLKPVMWVEK